MSFLTLNFKIKQGNIRNNSEQFEPIRGFPEGRDHGQPAARVAGHEGPRGSLSRRAVR